MGVKGLWPMLESAAGKADLHNASGKVLAVDISIWIQQIVKGMRDGRGEPIPNAHIIGLISRIVKLLYFGIKPIFVYDGGTPALKAATVTARRTRRATGEDKLVEARKKQLHNRMKRYALGDKTALSTAKGAAGKSRGADGWEADMFDPQTIPDLPLVADESDESDAGDAWYFDASAVDFESADFHGLPYEIQHEILVERQESEKNRSQRTKMSAFSDADTFSRDQIVALQTRNKLSRLLDDIRAKLLCIESEDGVSYHKIVSEENTVYILEKKPTFEPRRSAPVISSAASLASSAAGAAAPSSPTRRIRSLARQRFQERKQALATHAGSTETLPAPGASDDTSDSDDSLSFAGSCDEADGNDDGGAVLPRDLAVDSTESAVDNDPALQQALLASVASDADDRDKRTGFGGRAQSPGDDSAMQEALLASYAVDAIDKTHSNATDEKTHAPPRRSPQPVRGDPSTPSTRRVESTSAVPPAAPEPEAPIDTDARSESVAAPRDDPLTENAMSPPMSIHQPTPSLAEATPDSRTPPTTVDTTVDRGQTVHRPGVGATSFGQGSNRMASTYGSAAAAAAPSVEPNTESSSESETELVEVPSIDIDPVFDNTKSPSAPRATVSSGVMASTALTTIGVMLPTSPDQPTELDAVSPVSVHTDGDESGDEMVTDAADNGASAMDASEAIDVTEEFSFDDELAGGITVGDVVSGAASTSSAAAALVREQYDLDIEAKRAAQAAAGVTAGMMAETQALLRLFGVPYMVAPMEAEAQCAALELDGVTQGTITDDSDVFLFGGKTVYRRVSSTAKEPEVYTSDAVDQYLGLDREKLIRLGYLLGCDYTPGIAGVGVVTAMEILAEFPGADCLQRFKTWLHSDDPGGNRVRQGLKKRKKPFLVTDSFPDARVQQAFLLPQVEKRSLDSFEWGAVDVEALRGVMLDRLGWAADRTDQALSPALNPSTWTSQRPVTDFFAVDPGQVGNVGRKRFNAAVARVKRTPSDAAAASPALREAAAGSASNSSAAKRRRRNGKSAALD